MPTIYKYKLTLVHNADSYGVDNDNTDSYEVLMHLGTFVKGDKGDDGDSAYQVAVNNGFVGTEEEWLASLQGSDADVTAGNIAAALGYAPYRKPDDGIPKSDLSSGVQTSLEKADTALQSETDPTVPSWAKQQNKPSYTPQEIGAQPTLESGVNIKTINNQSILGEGDITIGGGSPDAVLYTQQTLTTEQQAQARANIGAGTYSKPSGGIPSTDIANFKNIYSGTTAYWNGRTGYQPAAGDVIIYTDKATVDGKDVPGIKIGGGNGYVQDLAFVADDIAAQLLSHINDNTKHITAGERMSWNNKITISDTTQEVTNETLIFTRN